MIPAKRSRFFVHWRGRSATRAASGSDRRCGRSTIGAGTLMPRWRLVAGRAWEDELEAAARSGLGLELDAAAERSGQLVCDCEPETRAGVGTRPERAEDAFAL